MIMRLQKPVKAQRIKLSTEKMFVLILLSAKWEFNFSVTFLRKIKQNKISTF